MHIQVTVHTQVAVCKGPYFIEGMKQFQIYVVHLLLDWTCSRVSEQHEYADGSCRM